MVTMILIPRSHLRRNKRKPRTTQAQERIGLIKLQGILRNWVNSCFRFGLHCCSGGGREYRHCDRKAFPDCVKQSKAKHIGKCVQDLQSCVTNVPVVFQIEVSCIHV